MRHSSEARDRFLSESAFPRSLDNRKEQVQKILSLADVRIDGHREWDITVNNDRFYSRVLRHGSLGLGESYLVSVAKRQFSKPATEFSTI
jgi:hypothetical protein